MMEYVKGYHIFLSQRWLKWLVYLIYPAVMIGGMYMFRCLLGNATFLLGSLAGASVVGAEILMDMFLYKGVGAKDTNRLEYLKTSVKGLPLLRKSLITDAVRRFLSLLVIFMGVYALMGASYEMTGMWFPFLNGLYAAIEFFAVIEIALLITRSFSILWIDFVVIYIWSGIGAAIFLMGINPWCALFFAVVGIFVSVVCRKRIMKKARESYYDERLENGI